MLDVSQQLRAMSGALQTLVQHSERSTPAGSDLGLCWRPNDFLTNDDQELSQGYRGDSSFDAHVASLTEAMRSEDSPYHDFRQLQILEGPQDRTPTTVPHPRRQAGADVEDRRITPLRPISKLLRLLQREKQLFFCELPIIDEQEFADSCRAVCFTTESYPLSTWITVNLGLFYLFHGLQSRHYTEIEVSSEDVDEYLELLSSNADMAAQSLRLCVEPSIKTCSALMMLVRDLFAGTETLTYPSVGRVLLRQRTKDDSMEPDHRGISHVSRPWPTPLR